MFGVGHSLYLYLSILVNHYHQYIHLSVSHYIPTAPDTMPDPPNRYKVKYKNYTSTKLTNRVKLLGRPVPSSGDLHTIAKYNKICKKKASSEYKLKVRVYLHYKLPIHSFGW